MNDLEANRDTWPDVYVTVETKELEDLRTRLQTAEQQVKEAYQKGVDESFVTNQQLLKDANFCRSESRAALSVLKSNTEKLKAAEQQLGQVREEVKGLRGVLEKSDYALYDAESAGYTLATGDVGGAAKCKKYVTKWKAERDAALQSDGCGKGRTDITAWIAQARRKFKLDKDSSAPWSHYHLALEDLEKFLAASSSGKDGGE